MQHIILSKLKLSYKIHSFVQTPSTQLHSVLSLCINRRKNAKLGQWESGRVTSPTFEIWDPISLERLELEISNLASRLITRGTNDEM